MLFSTRSGDADAMQVRLLRFLRWRSAPRGDTLTSLVMSALAPRIAHHRKVGWAVPKYFYTASTSSLSAPPLRIGSRHPQLPITSCKDCCESPAPPSRDCTVDARVLKAYHVPARRGAQNGLAAVNLRRPALCEVYLPATHGHLALLRLVRVRARRCRRWLVAALGGAVNQRVPGDARHEPTTLCRKMRSITCRTTDSTICCNTSRGNTGRAAAGLCQSSPDAGRGTEIAEDLHRSDSAPERPSGMKLHASVRRPDRPVLVRWARAAAPPRSRRIAGTGVYLEPDDGLVRDRTRRNWRCRPLAFRARVPSVPYPSRQRTCGPIRLRERASPSHSSCLTPTETSVLRPSRSRRQGEPRWPPGSARRHRPEISDPWSCVLAAVPAPSGGAGRGR